MHSATEQRLLVCPLELDLRSPVAGRHDQRALAGEAERASARIVTIVGWDPTRSKLHEPSALCPTAKLPAGLRKVSVAVRREDACSTQMRWRLSGCDHRRGWRRTSAKRSTNPPRQGSYGVFTLAARRDPGPARKLTHRKPGGLLAIATGLMIVCPVVQGPLGRDLFTCKTPAVIQG